MLRLRTESQQDCPGWREVAALAAVCVKWPRSRLVAAQDQHWQAWPQQGQLIAHWDAGYRLSLLESSAAAAIPQAWKRVPLPALSLHPSKTVGGKD